MQSNIEFVGITPLEFEEYCRLVFRLEGWNASSTPGSGDQGADIVCSTESMRVVVQCKLYGQPVGNAAVQEVLAARLYYGASKAVVVTNSTYTRSAVELATRCDVELVHEEQLRAWARKHHSSVAEGQSVPPKVLSALAGRGIRVKSNGANRFVLEGSSGIRHIYGEAALLAFVETLLGAPKSS